MTGFDPLDCSGCDEQLEPAGFSIGVAPEMGVVALCLDCAAEQAAKQMLAGESPDLHFIDV